MRFCYPFTLTASSRDAKDTPNSYKCIRVESGVQSDQPESIVFFPSAIFLQQIARPAQCPENLTEFPVAHNFSKRDLEGL